MPVARVRTPTGEVIRISVPEGATPAEIQSFAEQASRERQGQGPTLGPGSFGPMTIGPAPSAEARLPQPGAQIPEVIAPSIRETPRAETPLEAAQFATAGEVKRFGLGAQSLMDLAMGRGLERRKALRDIGEIEQEQAERAEVFPKSTFAGQMAPYMAIPGAAVSTPLRAMATGGAVGGIASGGDPMATGFGAAGGLGGQLAGAAIGRTLSRAQEGHTPFQRRAIEGFREMGGGLTPAQETGTRGLQIIEAGMESSPMMAGKLDRMLSRNQSVANRAAAEAMGETGDVIDDQVFARAQRRLGNEFDAVADAVGQADVDDAFLERLADAQAGTIGSIIKTPEARRKVQETIDNIIDQADNGILTGPQLKKFSEEARTAAFRASSKADPDRNLADAYSAIGEAIDDLLLRSAPDQGLAQRISTMREQYRAFKLLQNRGVVKQGNLNPSVLANVLASKAPNEYKLGGRQGTATPIDRLFATARFGEAVARPFGRSGTAERQSLGQAAPYLGTGLAGTLATGEAAPIIAGAAAFGAPWGFSRLYNRYPAVTGLLNLPAATTPAMGGIGGRVGVSEGQRIEPPRWIIP